MKIVILSVLILFPRILFCQQQKVSLEINAGAAFYQPDIVSSKFYTMPRMPGDPGYVAQVNRSINASALVAYHVNERLSVKAGIGYQLRRFITDYPAAFVSKSESTIRFFSVPVRIQYNLLKPGRLEMFVSGGFSARFSNKPDKFLEGFLNVNSNKRPAEFDNILRSRNIFHNGSYGNSSFNNDSSISITTTYYQFSKVDLFANAGFGISYKLSKKLSVQILADYNLQLNRGNFFGKYYYHEKYTNGTFVGKFEEHIKTEKFRDNFYTASAGLLYKFR